ncbi:MAG: c-di-GMP phosphodiesterase [Thiomicrorhabdus sp.]|nr:MAG: c-di-GMP phosphodiesterase [Thiomicrorhabdus sp.]
MSEVFIGRQPVLDTEMNVFAYELQFHQGVNPNEKTLEATEALIKSTQEKVGFQSIVGEHTAMLHLPSQLINKDSLPAFDEEHQIVLEIPNTVLGDPKVLRNLKELKSMGSTIALDNFIDDDASIKLASISDYVKIDAELHSEMKLKTMIDELHDKGIKAIALNVDTEEKFQHLKKLGFDYFQGYFFNNPVIINGQKLTGNKLVLLQLLAKVNDPTTDFNELSNIVSQDVALSHKLLIAINNPAAMIPIQVDSVADALRYLGLKRLKFWVNMLMLSSMKDVPTELLITSLMRARFCEILAESTGRRREKDSFFLVGLFSSLGAFFKTPIEDIVEDMPLSDEVKAALTKKEGVMGHMLTVLVAMEQNDIDVDQLNFESLGVSEIAAHFLSANAWAQQAMADEKE